MVASASLPLFIQTKKLCPAKCDFGLGRRNANIVLRVFGLLTDSCDFAPGLDGFVSDDLEIPAPRVHQIERGVLRALDGQVQLPIRAHDARRASSALVN